MRLNVMERDLVLEDLYVEPAHVKDPSLVFDGLIGCQEIKQLTGIRRSSTRRESRDATRWRTLG